MCEVPVAAKTALGLVLLIFVAALGYCCQPPAPSTPDPDAAATAPQPSASAPEASTDAAVETTPPDAPEPHCLTLEGRAMPRELPKRPRTVRIVGGTVAPEGRYPFAAALAFRSGGELRQYCGASLIEPDWLLTAAHCQVRVGELALVGSRDLTKAEEVPLVAVRTHHLYDADSSDYDVAVVQLGRFLTLPRVELATARPTSDVVAIGWGRMSEGGNTTSLLRHVGVSVDSTCALQYAAAGLVVTSQMLCAGGSGADSCQGDSGGPLLQKTAAGFVQVGVTSWGIGCARPHFPGVYASVADLRPWIEACAQ